MLNILISRKQEELLKRKEELQKELSQLSQELKTNSDEILEIQNKITSLEEEIKDIDEFYHNVLKSFNDFNLKTLDEKFSNFYYRRVRLSHTENNIYKIEEYDPEALLVLVKKDKTSEIGFLIPLPNISISESNRYIFEGLFNLPRAGNKSRIVELINPCIVMSGGDNSLEVLKIGYILYAGEHRPGVEDNLTSLIVGGKLEEKEELEKLLKEKIDKANKTKDYEEKLRGELFSVTIEIENYKHKNRNLLISSIFSLLILILLIYERSRKLMNRVNTSLVLLLLIALTTFFLVRYIKRYTAKSTATKSSPVDNSKLSDTTTIKTTATAKESPTDEPKVSTVKDTSTKQGSSPVDNSKLSDTTTIKTTATAKESPTDEPKVSTVKDTSTKQGSSQEVVTFSDPNLEKILRKALGIPEGQPITRADMTKLTSLEASSMNIKNLSGLEYAVNLQELELGSNQISDIKVLANLTNLQVLDLSRNQIKDINPLANLTNLQELTLNANKISDISPLAKLTNLQKLYLNGNKISDISPLVSNNGLGQGDWVWLENNLLDLTPGSDDMQNIQILQNRGVVVIY